MTSKFIKIIGITMLLLSFSSCSNISSTQRSMYEDETLIAAQGDSYFYASRRGNIEPTIATLDIVDFWGKETLWNLEMDQDIDLQLAINIQVSSGKLKICLVYNHSVVENIAVGSRPENSTISLQAGLNQVVMVGNQAQATVILQIISTVNH